MILHSGGRLLAAPASPHLGGFALGCGLTQVCGSLEDGSRTIAIEVGMQNSGLGTHLADEHFPRTVAPVPGAIGAVHHRLVGCILAGLRRMRPENERLTVKRVQSSGVPPAE